MSFTPREIFETEAEMYKKLYYQLAYATSRHLKSAQFLTDTLNETLDTICQNDKKPETHNVVMDLFVANT